MTLALKRQVEDLSAEATARYARHLSIPEVGRAGQERLRAARVLVIGAGGLGSPVLMYLAAAGVGTIGVVDDDHVETSNLQRQVIHSSADRGRPKVASARGFINALNPEAEVPVHQVRVDAENVLALIEPYDIVIDGSDNFPTRYLINDASVLSGKPCVWGSVYQFTGQVSVFWSGRGPCYRCLFPDAPPAQYAPSCVEGGVFGAVCGMVGSLQAGEALKLITGVGEPLLGRLWSVDVAGGSSRVLRFDRQDDCAVCGTRPTITTPELSSATCAVTHDELPSVTAAELMGHLQEGPGTGGKVEVWDIREEHEWVGGTVPGARLLGSAALQKVDVPGGVEDVVIYCQGGVRSARELPKLLARGVPARHLEGGFNAWQDSERESG